MTDPAPRRSRKRVGRRPGDRGGASLPPGVGARKAALDLIDQVIGRGRALDEGLGSPAMNNLSGPDRALARLLAATVLRRWGELDRLLSHFLDRRQPGQKFEALLAIGLAQLLFLEQPPHAAVGTAVATAKTDRSTQRFSGVINAVLRRAMGEAPKVLRGLDPVKLNTPEWLRERWRKAYGDDGAAAIMAAHMEEAPLDISLNPSADTSLWAERLEAERLPTGSLRRPSGGAIPSLPGYEEGLWWVQDAAAALPATLLKAGPGMKIVDLCAAPGGKTAQLAAAGAEVIAVDRAPARLDRLRDNLKRLNLSATTVTGDAATWRPDAPVDAVLLDAPCSATGTIRRHPDIVHLKRADDIAGLARIQATILSNAAAMVKPGGALVYCTCSLEPEEGERQAAAFSASGAPVEPWPITSDEVGGLESLITGGGEIRSHPGLSFPFGRLDGFHIARFRRK